MTATARIVIATALLLCASSNVLAASTPKARDVEYPGVLTLHVDATDPERRILRVHETIPVRSGPLTLFYPKWIPGNHYPSGPISSLAGLVITAAGQPVPWTRDPVNMFAFHLEVPRGARQLDIEFQFVSALQETQMLGLSWNTVVLYPAGHFARRITVRPSMRLPQGWKFATALDGVAREGEDIRFSPVTLEMLVDSPVYAGVNFRSIELDPQAPAPVRLHLVADAGEHLAVGPEALAAYSKLTREAFELFGSRHYDHYEFLLSLSDTFERGGLEHHRSSENGHGAEYFTDWANSIPGRDLLAHEYTHSWNGKFRLPVGLATPNYDEPMQSELLWVYEGMTEYWGYVLTARSGLWSAQQARDRWAEEAATFERNRPGRRWRDLQDTTHQPALSGYDGKLPWESWQREADYYAEAALVWLDADTKIRELTQEQRSLDDFARAFFGVRDGELGPLPYTFEDVVRTLEQVVPNDWGRFLRERLTSHGDHAPLDGLARGGWQLVFADEPSEYTKAVEAADGSLGLLYSIGIVVSKEGELSAVRWGSPAYDAGLAKDTKLIAVNGREYEPQRLKEAIRAARGGSKPIELLVKNLDRYRVVSLRYDGGLQYPHLQRVEGTPDRLSGIMKPRT